MSDGEDEVWLVPQLAAELGIAANPADRDGLSPLWCANDEPHSAHEARNMFGGFNYCTGRPSS